MKYSAMFYRLFLLSALLFGLSLPAATAGRTGLQLHIRRGQKISELSGEPLITAACGGTAEFESECVSTLQSAPPHQKADSNGLAFFTLKFVEDHAVNLTVDIQKYISDPDLAPLFQSALSDCLDQYNPLDDLIEDAINAVLAKDYGGAKKFVEAAVTNINSCDAEFKANDVQEEVEKKAGEDVQLAKNLKEYNLFLKKMLSASLNILNAN